MGTTQLTRDLEAALNGLSDATFLDLLIAVVAMGMAASACDGELHPAELAELDAFVTSVGGSALPDWVKADIAALRADPPAFEEALTLVRKVNRVWWGLFDQVIDVVIAADGVLRPEEEAFRARWTAVAS